MWRNISYFFLTLSLLSFVAFVFLLWQRYYNPNRLSFSSIPPVQTSKFQFFPDRIIISDLGVDLPVIASEIKNGIWQTTHLGVSYLMSSTRPGEIGNSVFYGHNWPNILGNLKKIQPGQKIVLSSKNDTRTYWVSKTMIVSPNRVDLLSSGLHAQLTLYTCYGFADLQRFVVIAYTQAPK